MSDKVKCLSAKRGWLKIGRGLGKKSETLWFEVDIATAYVTYFTNSPELGAIKSNLVGTLNLENAQISTREKKSKKELKYQIIVKQNKGKKVILTTGNEEDRNDWHESLTKIRNCKTKKQLLKEYKEQDDPYGCVDCLSGFSPDDEDVDSGDTSVDVTYNDLFSLPVEHHNGAIISFGDLIGERATIFLLMRHFGCMLCRHSAGIFTKLKPALDAIGIDLVAFGTGTPVMAKAFKKEQGFRGKIMVDQKRQVYQALNCLRGMKYSLTKGTWQASKVARENGHSQGATQGDLYQIGGVFIISKADGILYSHNDKFAGDFADTDEVLKFCQNFVQQCDNWSSPKITADLTTNFWRTFEPLNQRDRQNQVATASNGYHIEMGLYFLFFKEPGTDSGSVEVSLTVIDKHLDTGYYYEFFFESPHANYLSEISNEPIIISLWEPKKGYSTKAIIRTKQQDFRVLIPAKKSSSYPKMLGFINQLAALDPENNPFAIGQKIYKINTPILEQQLVEFEKSSFTSQYQFSVMYAKQNQRDNFQNFGNEILRTSTTENFEKFLTILGERILLKGFQHFNGGLDTKEEKDGVFSVFSKFKSYQIMFHVATLLPNQPKKRIIGNDLVVVIFKEVGYSLDPSWITSETNQVFIIVSSFSEKRDITARQNSKKKSKSEYQTKYRVAIVTKPDIPPFPPYLPSPPVFEDKRLLKKFLLTKMINAERTVLKSNQFKQKKEALRKDLLLDIIQRNVRKLYSYPSSLSAPRSLQKKKEAKKQKPETSEESFSAESDSECSENLSIDCESEAGDVLSQDEGFVACVELKALIRGFSDDLYSDKSESFAFHLKQLREYIGDEITIAKLCLIADTYLNLQKKARISLTLASESPQFVDVETQFVKLLWEIMENIKKTLY